MSDLGPVIITSREIYDQLVRLTTAVEGLVRDHGQVKQDLSEVRHDLGDHEARLRSLEHSRWPLPSIAALVSIAALAVAVVPLVAR